MTSKSWPGIDAFQRQASSRRPELVSDSRKRHSDETYERPSKRSKTRSASPQSCWTSHKGGSKRKSDEELETSSRRRKLFYVSSADSSEQPGPSSSGYAASTAKAHFEAKYQVGEKLGSGTFGRVHAGFRRDDHTPVAIKHVNYLFVDYVHVGNEFIPNEVFLMQKVRPAQGESSAAITLLDWYMLEHELVLVIERPIPCMNLRDYVLSKDRFLSEDEAKVIIRQLVDAAIELHSKDVLHRDIKMPNVLVETGSDVPRVRIIDFGCGILLSEDKNADARQRHIKKQAAEIMTSRQIGEVAFELLYGHRPLHSRIEALRGHVPVKPRVSQSGQQFLSRFLTFDEHLLNLESVRNDLFLL